MASYRFTLLTLPLAVASLAVAACGTGGSDDATGGGPNQQQVRDAGLKFAKCMRNHGVDMPDPQTSKGGGIMMSGPEMGKVDKPTLDRAQKACQKILESVRPPELSNEDEQKLKERALKFARCMRDEGIDYPDPTFQSGGGMTQGLERGTRPDDPRFRDAMEKCSKYQPDGPKFQSAK